MKSPSTTFRTLRRLLGAILLGLLLLAGGALATKRIGYVVTNGVSMQPTYYAGDLVIVARASSYQQGDIVAYHGGAGRHTEVLHRIIGGDAGGYVFKGDNNQSTDPLQPTADQLIGRAVVHIPRVGALLHSPITRGVVFLAVLGLLGLLFVNPTSKRRSQDAAPRRSAGLVTAWKGLIALDLVLAAALALSFPLAPAPRVAPAPAKPVNQTGVLTYQAKALVSDTYPTGEIATGDPVFLKLVNTLGVSFHYSTDGPPEAVTGTAHLDAELSNTSGWHTTLPLVAPTPLAAGAADLTGTLDLARIQGLADSVAKATGAGGGVVDVTVTASAAVSLGGAAPKTFTSELPLKLTSVSLTPSSKVTPVPTAHGPGVSSTSPLTTPAKPAPKPADSMHGLRIALVVALLAGLAATALIWPSTPANAGTVRTPIVGADLAGTARIQIADRGALDALAARLDAPVIESDNGWQAVLAPGVVYWVGTSLPAPAVAAPSLEPQPADPAAITSARRRHTSTRRTGAHPDPA